MNDKRASKRPVAAVKAPNERVSARKSRIGSQVSGAKPPVKGAKPPVKSAKPPAIHEKSRASRTRTRGSKHPLDRVRKICLALPEAAEKIAWGAPTFRVRDKIFAMYLENHHNDGRIALWCNAPKGLQEVLVGSEPKRFFKPPYVGPRGWIGLHLLANSDEEIESFVREAYLMTAPKKLRLALEE